MEVKVSKESLDSSRVLIKFGEEEKLKLGKLVAEYVVDDYESREKLITDAEGDMMARTCAAFARFLQEKCEVYGQLDLFMAINADDDEDDEDEEEPVDGIKN